MVWIMAIGKLLKQPNKTLEAWEGVESHQKEAAILAIASESEWPASRAGKYD